MKKWRSFVNTLAPLPMLVDSLSTIYKGAEHSLFRAYGADFFIDPPSSLLPQSGSGQIRIQGAKSMRIHPDPEPG
jgi:hypothetical protein